jgi:hypothetical protein
VTFSRKRDTQFKGWIVGQNLLYAIHFFLMGNLAAMVGSTLSSTRTLLSLYTRSLVVIAILLTANVLLGFWVVKAAWNVIPLTATAIATVAMFRLHGLQLRCVMLLCTILWLINNILTGSIGGTAMESMIAVMSCFTIFRLRREMTHPAC